MDLQALWDTGATNSGISSAMAKRLGLLPIRRAEVEGANGLFTANVYILDITLPNMVSVHNVQVREFVSAGDSDVILGMDIITCGDFAVSNYERKTVVSFRVPSQKPPIDFRQK
jgi:predicted aspartyl protease